VKGRTQNNTHKKKGALSKKETEWVAQNKKVEKENPSGEGGL